MSYGCKDRAPLKTKLMVQSGWVYIGDTRAPRMVIITDPMTKSCQYQKDDRYNDLQCQGCKWKESHDA